MSDNVILLGAGFSFDAGIPLLSGFVDKMWEYAIRKSNNGKPLSPEDSDLFAKAINIRGELDSYHGRAHFDDRNIEDILSILSFNELAGEKKDQEKLVTMSRAIARNIELSCQTKHPGLSTDHSYSIIKDGPEIYRTFWEGIFDFVKKGNRPPTIITFNYDLVLERSLFQTLINTTYNSSKRLPFDKLQLSYHTDNTPGAAYSVDYITYQKMTSKGVDRYEGTKITNINFNDISPSNKLEIDLLKLHGSVNFSKEKQESDFNLCHAVNDPFILPPIFNKMTSTSVNRMWEVALQRLRVAKNIIIVGYSLPKTDIYMQYFLKAALGPNRDLNKIFVFDPLLWSSEKSKNDMKERYEVCFSPQLRNRICFNPETYILDEKVYVPYGTAAHFIDLINRNPGSLFF